VSHLRDLGCPDTLIKDVRNVAAAVCAARGRDGRKEVGSSGNSGQLIIGRVNRLQGKTREAIFRDLRFLKGLITCNDL